MFAHKTRYTVLLANVEQYSGFCVLKYMKDIKGFENKYAITEGGKVWNCKTKKWLSLRGSGYAGKVLRHKRHYKTIVLGLGKKGRVKYFYIHRLVAITFIPNPQKKREVNHIDGNQENNHISNLEWVTHKENAQHAYLNGLTTRGEKNTQTKLTEKQVLEIRSLYVTKQFSHKKLGEKYGVTPSNIYMIIHRKNWSYLKESDNI